MEDPDLQSSNDLTTISDINIEKVNAVLVKRYDRDVVYVSFWNLIESLQVVIWFYSNFNQFFQTYSGSILISVNPYKELPHIYDEV